MGSLWFQDFTPAFRTLEEEEFNMKMEWGLGDSGGRYEKKKLTFSQPVNERGREVFVLGKTRKPTLTEHLLHQVLRLSFNPHNNLAI